MFARLSKFSMWSRQSILSRYFTDENQKKAVFFKGSNFDDLLSGDYIFSDKTLLIKDSLKVNYQIITRPKGWGKTLNLRMIESFFHPKVESDGTFSQDLQKKEKFRKLEIGSETLSYNPITNLNHLTWIIDLQGTVPVVFLEFEDMRPKTERELELQLAEMMSKTIKKHLYLFESKDIKSNRNLKILKEYVEAPPDINDSRKWDIRIALESLIKSLHKHFGTRVILLVDGYDKILMSLAEQNSKFFNYGLDLFTDLYSIFKSKTDYLIQFSILTGVFKIRTSGELSVLNHFIYDPAYYPKNIFYYGIGDYELRVFINQCNKISKKKLDVEKVKEKLKKYYNGYTGYDHEDDYLETRLLNPASLMNCLNNLVTTDSDPYLNYFSRINSTEILENSLAELKNKKLIDILIEENSIDFIPDDFLFMNANNQTPDKNISILKQTVFESEVSLLTYMVDAGYLKSRHEYKSFFFPNLEVYETFVQNIAPVWIQTARPYLKNCVLTDAEVENNNLFCESFQNKILNQFDIDKPNIVLKSLVYFSMFTKGKLIENYSPHFKSRSNEIKSNLMLLPIKNRAESIYVIEYIKNNSYSKRTLEEKIIHEIIYDHAFDALNLMEENAHIKKIIFRVVPFIPKEKSWSISAYDLIFDKKALSSMINDMRLERFPNNNLLRYVQNLINKNNDN